MSRAQFARVRDYLALARQRTKPRRVACDEVFCAIRYTLQNGCAWRNLPGDFPRWPPVYKYARQWSAVSAT
ncbi:MAG: transposase, partial [Verrucomicrobiales bacterium]|nr:transposase [Verrucomicrobiales bacterium]